MIGETSSDVVTPDVAEAIVGYRAWRVNLKGDGYEPEVLISVNGYNRDGGKLAFWEKGVNEAKCTANKLYRAHGAIPEHAHFHPQCTCGFYAFKSLEEVVNQYSSANVYGEVWLWGQVIEGTKGYRAEKAEVKRLFSRYQGKSEWEELAKEQYQCSCDECGHEHMADYWTGYYVDAEWLGRIAEKYGVETVEPVIDEGWEPEKPEPLSLGRLSTIIQQNLLPFIQQQAITPSVFHRYLTGNVNIPTSSTELLDTDTRLRRAGLIPASGNDPARNNGGGMDVLWLPGDKRVVTSTFKGTPAGWTIADINQLVGQQINIDVKGLVIP